MLARKAKFVSQGFSITVNGRPLRVSEETSVAAAMMMANEPCRVSVRGEPRGPLCGMGICMECRAMVNGKMHQRTCQMMCAPAMEVVTE
jgi:D-hydroxyproline dehydrogenase subunit gamma